MLISDWSSDVCSSDLVAVQGIPAEWTNLASLVGKYPGSYAKDNIDLFDKGTLAAALKARMGPKMAALRTNLSAVSPLQRAGNYYYLSGNAQHQGGVEQAYIIIDPARPEVRREGKESVSTCGSRWGRNN